jgi:hypothetical protein
MRREGRDRGALLQDRERRHVDEWQVVVGAWPRGALAERRVAVSGRQPESHDGALLAEPEEIAVMQPRVERALVIHERAVRGPLVDEPVVAVAKA